MLFESMGLGYLPASPADGCTSLHRERKPRPILRCIVENCKGGGQFEGRKKRPTCNR